MGAIVDDELAAAAKANTATLDVLCRLLGAEAQALIERRIERRIDESDLPERPLLADFDFDFQTGVDKTQVMNLATLGFVEQRQSLILAGNSGTGKSHIAKALLLTACRKQLRCRYTTAANMLKALLSGLCDDSLEDKLKRYVAPDILLIDELGLDRLEQESARNAALFQKVIEGRYCKKTTILTTNIDFAALGTYLGDPVVTTATIDRLIHHAIIVNINGPSWRMHQSKLINQAQVRGKEAAKKS